MKKKQWEPETQTGWSNGVFTSRDRPSLGWNHYYSVRILREKDYQRLLKLARKAQTHKT